MEYLLRDSRRVRTSLVIFASLATAAASAADRYTVQVLSKLPGGTVTQANAINAAGEVVGQADGTTAGTPPMRTVSAVLWKDGIPSIVYQGETSPPDFYPYSFSANAVNAGGQIVGTVNGPNGSGFFWSPSTASPVELSLGDAGTASASGINESGAIVGGITSGPSLAAALWSSPAAPLLALPQLSNSGESFANAINSGGEIVGQSYVESVPLATSWSSGTHRPSELATLGGAGSAALAINDAATIVGWAETSSGQTHAVRWQESSIEDLGALGGTTSSALAINSAGNIVGTSGHAGCCASHAVAWYTGSDGPTDLNDEIGTNSQAIQLVEAVGINDACQIAVNGYSQKTGAHQSYLLTPIAVAGNGSCGPPKSVLRVLACTQGGSVYSVIAPSNSISSNVSPNPSGTPSICAPPSTEPATWWIKTSEDNGVTWAWVYKLGSLGLGEK